MKENKHDSKKLWNLIKCLTNDTGSSPDCIKRLKEEDGFLTEKLDIANELNTFFLISQKICYTSMTLAAILILNQSILTVCQVKAYLVFHI